MIGNIEFVNLMIQTVKLHETNIFLQDSYIVLLIGLFFLFFLIIMAILTNLLNFLKYKLKNKNMKV